MLWYIVYSIYHIWYGTFLNILFGHNLVEYYSEQTLQAAAFIVDLHVKKTNLDSPGHIQVRNAKLLQCFVCRRCRPLSSAAACGGLGCVIDGLWVTEETPRVSRGETERGCFAG